MAQIKMRHYDPEIKILASLYDLLVSVSDGFPDKDLNAYTKKQKQCLIKNLIDFAEENAEILSPEINELIYPYPELAYDKLRKTLKSANEKYMNTLKARRDEWVSFAERFDKPTKDALIRFVDGRLSFDSIFSKDDKTGEIILTNEYASSYRQAIYFVAPVFSENFCMEYAGGSDAEIEMLGGGYRISLIQVDETATVDFLDIRLETQMLDYAHENTWGGSPWRQISDSLNDLKNKKDILGPDSLNEKEEALLPLCEFSPIHSFESPYQDQPVGGNKLADKLFIDFAVQAGNQHLAELTKLYSDIGFSEESPYPASRFKEKKKACAALHREMLRPSGEAPARLILSEIRAAAAQYPAGVEIDIAPGELANTRKAVTDHLKQRGYGGEYPKFKKMSSLKGAKLLEIQGQPVLVCHEKHMACMIDCFESGMNSINGEILGIGYTVSTVFLKKDELQLFDSLDGCSGFFPDKQRRRARILTPCFDFSDDDIVSYDSESSVAAAAKTAECEKLTKEERGRFLAVSPWKTRCLFFAVIFLFSGLAFASLFCPAMFLISLTLGTPVTAISSEAPSFSEYFFALLHEFPWRQMFLFCFVGFGGLFGLIMTIFTAISGKRG